MDDINDLILKQMADISEKLDKVRTEDIPNLKTDMALMVQSNKTSSRWENVLGSCAAVLVMLGIGHFKK